MTEPLFVKLGGRFIGLQQIILIDPIQNIVHFADPQHVCYLAAFECAAPVAYLESQRDTGLVIDLIAEEERQP